MRRDREIVTFDDAGGSYFGTVASVEGTTLHTTEDTKPALSWEWGGWYGAAIVVLNGTGTGQVRRVVQPGVNTTSTPLNRTWVVDRDFDAIPNEESYISIVPARQKILFVRDHYVDGGTIQTYGQAMDCVFADNVGTRITGWVAWGQWRGWVPPPAATATGGSRGITTRRLRFSKTNDDSRVGGVMGNGVMPNVHVRFLDNRVSVGNKVVRWNAGPRRSDDNQPEFGLNKFYAGATFATTGGTQDMPDGVGENLFVDFRRNVVDSNGGFMIASGGSGSGHVRDVVVEHNTCHRSNVTRAYTVDPSASLTLLRGNTATEM